MDKITIYKSCDKVIAIQIDNKNQHIIPIVKFDNMISLIQILTNISNMPWASSKHLVSILAALDDACQFEFDMPMIIVFQEDVNWENT